MPSANTVRCPLDAPPRGAPEAPGRLGFADYDAILTQCRSYRVLRRHITLNALQNVRVVEPPSEKGQNRCFGMLGMDMGPLAPSQDANECSEWLCSPRPEGWRSWPQTRWGWDIQGSCAVAPNYTSCESHPPRALAARRLAKISVFKSSSRSSAT